MFSFKNVAVVERDHSIALKVSVLNLISNRCYTFKCEFSLEDQMQSIEDQPLPARVASYGRAIRPPITR